MNNKQTLVDTIISYLGDDSLDIPRSARTDISINGFDVEAMKKWMDIFKDGLQSLIDSQVIFIMQEQQIANVQSYLQNIRDNLPSLTQIDQNAITTLSNIITWLEAGMLQITPYFNLVDNMGYRSLKSNLELDLLEVAEKTKKS